MDAQELILIGNAAIQAARRANLPECAYQLEMAINTLEHCLEICDNDSIEFAANVLQTEIDDFKNRRNE